MTDHDTSHNLPRTIVILVALAGVVMASPWFYRWVDSWAPYSRSASREIGAALVGGAVVGGALVWLDVRLERQRQQRAQEDARRDDVTSRQRASALEGAKLLADSMRAVDQAAHEMGVATFRRFEDGW